MSNDLSFFRWPILMAPILATTACLSTSAQANGTLAAAMYIGGAPQSQEAALNLTKSPGIYEIWFVYGGATRVHHRTFDLWPTGKQGPFGQVFRVTSGASHCDTVMIRQATSTIVILRLRGIDLHFAKAPGVDKELLQTLYDVARENAKLGAHSAASQFFDTLPACSART